MRPRTSLNAFVPHCQEHMECRQSGLQRHPHTGGELRLTMLGRADKFWRGHYVLSLMFVFCLSLSTFFCRRCCFLLPYLCPTVFFSSVHGIPFSLANLSAVLCCVFNAPCDPFHFLVSFHMCPAFVKCLCHVPSLFSVNFLLFFFLLVFRLSFVFYVFAFLVSLVSFCFHVSVSLSIFLPMSMSCCFCFTPELHFLCSLLPVEVSLCFHCLSVFFMFFFFASGKCLPI